MSKKFILGQRWISESEPELGLGTIRGVDGRVVSVAFAASGEHRQYAIDNVPLRRVMFRAGDSIKQGSGPSLLVESVMERNGLLYYRCAHAECCETELSAAISFNQPGQRLLNGQVDAPEVFDLRYAALQHQHRRRKSKVRGFVGARIELIPHQLYIAPEVASRMFPRVLLADEVGLGKTIEACLILHRLIQTGRARRVLILVPEAIIHQWFVELLRRFNLWFHIFDEERCDAIESANPEANPFLDDQFVLCGINLLAGKERRTAQALAAGWDMLVVDEAHHLGWSPESVSPDYALVEALGRATPGLLLLTATPEQLGIASHFARLRLLDPDRYYDLDEFVKEAGHYRGVAQIAEKLVNKQELYAEDIKLLGAILCADEVRIRERVIKANAGDETVRTEFIDALLDQHGTGRVMFRNTRATIAGFPKRTPHLKSLKGDAATSAHFDQLADEFAADVDERAATTFEPQFDDDARIAWLADLLRTLPDQKILLICRTQSKVEAIDHALRQKITVKTGLFHEGLPLVQRDRNAAWFAEEDGARLLICSEIGSEGRNFQFAHHLVLFDLPAHPELLEQRIGRLDRIGQTQEIHIHVPYVDGSSQEVLARWYHEGLNAFERNLRGGRELYEQFGKRVYDLAQDFHETCETNRADLDRLIAETRQSRLEQAERLERGRDRLLELNSFRADAAASMAKAIRQQDEDRSLDAFLLAVFDHYNIHLEELRPRTYQLGSAGVFADALPGLPADGLTVTCDRQRALSRDDIQFLTWDHPLVTNALDLLLGSEQGNSSFGVWPESKQRGLCLEVIYLLECVAPTDLHLDRFLPPTPLRVVIDHAGKEVGSAMTTELVVKNLEPGDVHRILDVTELREELLPHLLTEAEGFAEQQMAPLVSLARKEMNAQLGHEITRLRELQRVNRNVRAEEVEALIAQQAGLDEHLAHARLRLDAVRLIQLGGVTTT